MYLLCSLTDVTCSKAFFRPPDAGWCTPVGSVKLDVVSQKRRRKKWISA